MDVVSDVSAISASSTGECNGYRECSECNKTMNPAVTGKSVSTVTSNEHYFLSFKKLIACLSMSDFEEALDFCISCTKAGLESAAW